MYSPSPKATNGIEMNDPISLGISTPQEESQKPKTGFRMRLYFLFVVFLLGYAVLAVRLFVIQVRDADKYQEIAHLQYKSREPLEPVRGLIYDRNLSILASNVTEYTVAVDPKVIEDKDSVAEMLAQYLPGTKASYLERLNTKKSRYVILEKHISESRILPLKQWNYYGVRFDAISKRKYNFNDLAGPIIGYTNVDNRGQSGIELAFNEELSGEEGFIVYQLNAKRYKRPEVEYPYKEPINGRSIVLTIDHAYQSIAEDELIAGVKRHEAVSGRCIVMHPKSGEILAMANYPSLDPNNRAEYTPEKAMNRVVTDLYEPGSTFKVVTMSAALDEALYSPEDEIDAENGRYYHTPNEKPIVDDHEYGSLTLRGAFEHSSNIVSAKIAKELGKERMYEYARNFGFGIKTGIELPGELSGELRNPTSYDATTHLYMAFGYGLAATSLQIACAYAAIANDGILMRPYIRKWMIDGDRNIIHETRPQTIRRVVSSETAATMRRFMQGVVDSGTARNARIDGMSIGGKTGTSQRLVNGSYSNTSHVASFVGFFPVEDPKVLILVILDSPQKGYYGGTVAAPIFKNIAQRIISYSGEFAKVPDAVYASESGNKLKTVPDVRGLSPASAALLLHQYGLAYSPAQDSGIIVAQNPNPGNTLAEGGIVQCEVASDTGNGDVVSMPNLVGMTVRHANTLLTTLGLSVEIHGSGYVKRQSPEPGSKVEAPRCTLWAEAANISANLY